MSCWPTVAVPLIVGVEALSVMNNTAHVLPSTVPLTRRPAAAWTAFTEPSVVAPNVVPPLVA